MINKPFAESCEQNKRVILDVLQTEFSESKSLLEIASGTGQHAVYFANKMPHLNWQCSDRFSELSGLNRWINEAQLSNLPTAIELDVLSQWPRCQYDAVFSANAVHIMSWQAVEAMFKELKNCIKDKATVCLYGPFNYNGEFSSDSNARFDQWLKQRNPESGIRDFEKLNVLAAQCDLQLKNDYEMPANNRILCWAK